MALHTLIQYQDIRAKMEPEVGILVVDGDWLIMNALTASQFDEDWGDGIWTVSCDHNKAWEIMENNLYQFQTRKKAWSKAPMVLFFSSRPNYRTELAGDYKGNRAGTRKPAGYWDFEERVKEAYTCIQEPNLEADDSMGILASNPKPYGFKKAVIISVDKDFKTIPNCDFFHLTDGQIHQQTNETADYNWRYQTIIGDRTDGYSGIPSFGETTAIEFLDEPYVMRQRERTFKSGKRKGETVIEWYRDEKPEDYTVWDCMVTLAAYKDMTEDDLILQARLARILRAGDYGIETGEIKLWEPTK